MFAIYGFDMSEVTLERLFGVRHAFEHPVTLWVTVVIFGILVIASLAVAILAKAGRLSEAGHLELRQRIRSWWLLAPALLVPILLGAAWVMLGVLLLSIFCYREFARVTGLFRSPLVSLSVVLGILAISF